MFAQFRRAIARPPSGAGLLVVVALASASIPTLAFSHEGHVHARSAAPEKVATLLHSSKPAMPGEASLEEIRAATERFRDVNVALAEGYLRDPMNLCDTAEMMGKPPELGAMGIHFF